jgi:hypothetical protein
VIASSVCAGKGTGVLDNALALGRGVAVSCDIVYVLLTECL